MGTIPLQDSWNLVVVNLVFKLNVDLKTNPIVLEDILSIDMMAMASISFVKSFFFLFDVWVVPRHGIVEGQK